MNYSDICTDLKKNIILLDWINHGSLYMTNKESYTHLINAPNFGGINLEALKLVYNTYGICLYNYVRTHLICYDTIDTKLYISCTNTDDLLCVVYDHTSTKGYIVYTKSKVYIDSTVTIEYNFTFEFTFDGSKTASHNNKVFNVPLTNNIIKNAYTEYIESI